MRAIHTVVATAVLFVTLSAVRPTQAGLTFTLDHIAITAQNEDPGLVVETHAHSVPDFMLSTVGDSVTVDLFDIWTTETSVNPDDTVPKPISVEFLFTSPPPDFGGNVDGSTQGVSLAFGFIQFGEVSWDGPVELAFGGDGVLGVELSDETFNEGIFGLNTGGKKKKKKKQHGATVEATFTLLALPSPPGGGGGGVVPEASTFAIWGALAVIGAVVGRRARRS